MSKFQRILCDYCNTVNDAEASTCQACGAPIMRPVVPVEPKVTVPEEPAQPAFSEADLRKAADKADEVYFTLWNTYAIAWRTLGEAIAIALTGFVLGFLGGVTWQYFPGVLGAGLVGLAVGLTRKQFYFALISAPAGLLLGLGPGALVWALGGDAAVMVYTGLVGAILGAIVGARRNLPFGKRNCWERARPFLGLLGGLAFGLLGTLIGWGLRAGVEALITH